MTLEGAVASGKSGVMLGMELSVCCSEITAEGAVVASKSAEGALVAGKSVVLRTELSVL